ncbi:MAG: hypothetical protein LBT98_02980 [Puniceicoccales bacterium]|nr:hypothetical protein [Puniceicoccales bacterium]
MGRIFAAFAIFLLPAALAGSSLRDGGAAVLTPRQAEEFFRRAGEEMVPDGAAFDLCADGVPLHIACSGGKFFLTLGGKTITIDGTENPLRPVDETLALAPFDLLCPFFRWQEVYYEGPGNALGRAVQRFSAISPTGWTVRVGLDAKYHCPLCWDLNGPGGKLLRRFRLRSIIRGDDGEWGMGRAQIFIPEEERTLTIVPIRP